MFLFSLSLFALIFVEIFYQNFINLYLINFADVCTRIYKTIHSDIQIKMYRLVKRYKNKQTTWYCSNFFSSKKNIEMDFYGIFHCCDACIWYKYFYTTFHEISVFDRWIDYFGSNTEYIATFDNHNLEDIVCSNL